LGHTDSERNGGVWYAGRKASSQRQPSKKKHNRKVLIGKGADGNLRRGHPGRRERVRRRGLSKRKKGGLAQGKTPRKGGTLTANGEKNLKEERNT